MRVVICDTGPILHLHEAGALALLPKTGAVVIPPAVDAELDGLLPDWAAKRPTWLQVRRLESADEKRAMQLRGVGGLGPGEAEAIILARSAGADWLLTDDAGARIVAATLGLEVHGSLGVVLWVAVATSVRRNGGPGRLRVVKADPSSRCHRTLRCCSAGPRGRPLHTFRRDRSRPISPAPSGWCRPPASPPVMRDQAGSSLSR